MDSKHARRCASSRAHARFRSCLLLRVVKKTTWKLAFKVAAMTTSPSLSMEQSWWRCCRAIWVNEPGVNYQSDTELGPSANTFYGSTQQLECGTIGNPSAERSAAGDSTEKADGVLWAGGCH